MRNTVAFYIQEVFLKLDLRHEKNCLIRIEKADCEQATDLDFALLFSRYFVVIKRPV
jgi:hypothetical protein